MKKTYVYEPEATAPDAALFSETELAATSPEGTALKATRADLQETAPQQSQSMFLVSCYDTINISKEYGLTTARWLWICRGEKVPGIDFAACWPLTAVGGEGCQCDCVCVCVCD